MSNPTALPSADLSLEDLAEIICAAGIVGDSARLAQGEAAFVAAQTYGHGCYMELSRKSKVNHKTLAERARVVEFYSGDDVTVGSSFARTILESNEGMVTWTMLREAKGLGDWQLAVDAINHAIEHDLTPAQWGRYLRQLKRDSGHKQRKWIIEDHARRLRITIERI